MVIVTDESSTNVIIDGVSYPKQFYAHPSGDDIVYIRNKFTEKIFARRNYTKISIDTTTYDSPKLLVNALNLILSA